jgi:hypothetical protein
MKKFGRAGSTFATVVIAAIVIAIVGASGAVAGGLITSKKIKDNTIKSRDVRDGNLTGTDIANGSLTGGDLADGSVAGSDVTDGSLTQKDFTSSPAGLVRGYVYSGDANPALDTPVNLTASNYAFNSAGGTVIRTRTAVGRYVVAFGGLDLNAGNVQVSAYGSGPTWCNIDGWGGNSAFVACFDAAGAFANSPFTLAFTR